MANSVPTLTGLTTPVTFLENTVNAAPQLLDCGRHLHRPGQQFQRRRADGLRPAGRGHGRRSATRAPAPGEIGVSGSNVSFGGTVIGSVTGGAGDDAHRDLQRRRDRGGDRRADREPDLRQFLRHADREPHASSSRSPTPPASPPSRRSPSPSRPAPPIRSTASMCGLQTPRPASPTSTATATSTPSSGTTTARCDYFRNTGTAIAPAFARATGAANPFNGLDVGLSAAAPSFADLDGDGDFDAVVGGMRRHPALFPEHRLGHRAGVHRPTGAANPFNGVDVGDSRRAQLRRPRRRRRPRRHRRGRRRHAALFPEHRHGDRAGLHRADRRRQSLRRLDVGFTATPSFADLDGDGDLDASSGTTDGTLHYFENTGSATAPAFASRPAPPIRSTASMSDATARRASPTSTVTATSTPSSGIQRHAALSSRTPRRMQAAPDFAEQTGAANPFNGVDVGDLSGRASPISTATATSMPSSGKSTASCTISRTPARPSRRPSPRAPAPPIRSMASMSGSDSTPSFADLDGDGDLDAIVGDAATATPALFPEHRHGHRAGLHRADRRRQSVQRRRCRGSCSTPSFADLDGDGDLDAVVGKPTAPCAISGTPAPPSRRPSPQRTGAANPFNGVDVELERAQPSPTSTATATSTPSWGNSTAACSISRIPARPSRPSSPRAPAPPIRSTASMWGTSHAQLRRPRRRWRPRRHRGSKPTATLRYPRRAARASRRW